MNRRGALPFTVTDHFISLVLLHSPLKCIIFRINTLHIRFVLPLGLPAQNASFYLHKRDGDPHRLPPDVLYWLKNKWHHRSSSIFTLAWRGFPFATRWQHPSLARDEAYSAIYIDECEATHPANVLQHASLTSLGLSQCREC